MKTFLYLIISIVLILASCKKSKAGTESSAEKDDIVIAGLVFQEDQFFRFVKLGMEEAAPKAGHEFLGGNSDNKLDKEIQLVNTYSTRGVRARAVAGDLADIESLKGFMESAAEFQGGVDILSEQCGNRNGTLRFGTACGKMESGHECQSPRSIFLRAGSRENDAEAVRGGSIQRFRDYQYCLDSR